MVPKYVEPGVVPEFVVLDPSVVPSVVAECKGLYVEGFR